jgi:hypothetical protein
LPKLAEEILDQVSSFIELLVMERFVLSVACGWNHNAFPISSEPVNDPFMYTEGFAGNQRIYSDSSQQKTSAPCRS